MKRKVFGGVVGLLVVELALKSDEQISWNAEAELDAKGDGGADALFLANHVAKLGFAKVHGGGGGNLGDTVMGDGVPDEGGGRIGNGLGDFERVPWDGGWVQFHFRWFQWVSWILTSSTFFISAFSHWKVIRHGDLRESASMEYFEVPLSLW